MEIELDWCLILTQSLYENIEAKLNSTSRTLLENMKLNSYYHPENTWWSWHAVIASLMPAKGAGNFYYLTKNIATKVSFDVAAEKGATSKLQIFVNSISVIPSFDRIY